MYTKWKFESIVVLININFIIKKKIQIKMAEELGKRGRFRSYLLKVQILFLIMIRTFLNLDLLDNLLIVRIIYNFGPGSTLILNNIINFCFTPCIFFFILRNFFQIKTKETSEKRWFAGIFVIYTIIAIFSVAIINEDRNETYSSSVSEVVCYFCLNSLYVGFFPLYWIGSKIKKFL